MTDENTPTSRRYRFPLRIGGPAHLTPAGDVAFEHGAEQVPRDVAFEPDVDVLTDSIDYDVDVYRRQLVAFGDHRRLELVVHQDLKLGAAMAQLTDFLLGAALTYWGGLVPGELDDPEARQALDLVLDDLDVHHAAEPPA